MKLNTRPHRVEFWERETKSLLTIEGIRILVITLEGFALKQQVRWPLNRTFIKHISNLAVLFFFWFERLIIYLNKIFVHLSICPAKGNPNLQDGQCAGDLLKKICSKLLTNKQVVLQRNLSISEISEVKINSE